MVIVHVHVRVVAGGIDLFREASLANARASVQEPGVARFDVIQQEDDPTRFELIEVYRTPMPPPRTRRRHTTPPGATRWRR